MPPYFDRHLENVAELSPSSRHSAGTARPASTRWIPSMIWLSVNRDFFML